MSDDQVKEKLKQGLLKKIKETYHIKKDYPEALSYINYYISNIGTDDEILMYKNKIEKKITPEMDPIEPEENKVEPIFSESPEIPDQDIKTRIKTGPEPTEDKQDEHLLEPAFLVDTQEESEKKEDNVETKEVLELAPDELIQESDSPESSEELPAFDTFDDMFELEKKDLKKDQAKTESADMIKIKMAEDEEEIFDIENNQLPEDEKGLDLDFEHKDEPNILDLNEKNGVQPQDKKDEIEVISEVETPSKTDDVESSVRVDQEETFSFESPQISSLDEEVVEIQTETTDQLEPEQELSLLDDEEPVDSGKKKLLDFSIPSKDKPIIKPIGTGFSVYKVFQKFSKKQILIGIAVLVVLLAVILFFLLKNNDDLPETTPPKVESVKKKKTAAQKLAEIQKQKSLNNKIDAQNTEFKKYISIAEEYYKKGDYKKSQENIKLAKNIKTNAKLIQLENQIQKKISENNIEEILETPQPLKKVEPEISKEEKAYKRIASSDNISILEDFLSKYPAGIYAIEIKKRINTLKKKEMDLIKKQIYSDARLYKKIQLRSEFQYLSQQTIKTLINKAKKIKNRYESKILDGEKILIDYATGLMWHFWEEPMEFSKAKWWSARRYAGYHDWRLPSAEEVSSLLNISSGHIPPKIKSTQYEVWSGDFNNTDSSRLWVFIFSKKNFRAIDSYQYKYLCSVRSLIK